MSKSCLCLLCLLVAVCEAAAQRPDDGYYPYAVPEERTQPLTTDSTLFYRAVQSAQDLYGQTTLFSLPDVGLKRRGQDYTTQTITFDGLPISYRYTGALRLLGAMQTEYPGLASAPGTIGLAGGVQGFRFTDDVPLRPYLASVRVTDRNYLVGARIAASGVLGHGWRGAVAVDARTGRDMHVDGVFTQALTLGLRLDKSFGEDHGLALTLIFPPSVRGTRLSSTEQAFTLTGDRLYNPAWGFQDGRVRNSRVRRETVPLAALTYRRPLTQATRLEASFGAEAGIRKYSGLGWYDARTPMPDNYRYMPDYTQDAQTDAAWRRCDPRFTQVDWDRMILQNRMTTGHAIYTLEDRAERLTSLSAGLLLETHVNERLTLRYGARYRHRTSRFYKQMRDLLSADHIVDIDQYLIDDDTYGNLLQNDLRNPRRMIRKGDRFGYDYALRVREIDVRACAEYRSDRFRADVALSLGDAAVSRQGYYEKELFPAEQSYGPSRRMRFTPYVVKVLAGWSFSPRSYLEAAVMLGAAVPDAGDLFFQPMYNNRTLDNPSPERYYAAELNYRLTGRVLDLQLTGFATMSLDGVQTRAYYDDMAGVFCDMALTGIGRMACGVEAAARIRLSYRWQLSLAASAGQYKFVRNPTITVISDVDNTLVDSRAESYMGGCRIGGAPQFTALAEAGYFGPKGWGCRLSVGYAGGRYVEPSPLRRTERIARQGGPTPESFEAFTAQERLADAFTLDASLFKTFYFERSQLTAALMLRNLTGERDTAYGGYESMRVQRLSVGDETRWTPQASRYTYSYPRSFYLTVSYKF